MGPCLEGRRTGRAVDYEALACSGSRLGGRGWAYLKARVASVASSRFVKPGPKISVTQRRARQGHQNSRHYPSSPGMPGYRPLNNHGIPCNASRVRHKSPVYKVAAFRPIEGDRYLPCSRPAVYANCVSDNFDLVLMVEQLRNDHSVLLWQQGRLGELGIAAGAQGYETGIGWRERCDLPATMSSRRRAQSGGSRSGRPVFVAPLGRSVDKRSLEEICHHRDIWTRLICTDTDCCPDGGRAILDNGRGHTVVQRARRLSELGRIETPVWRWQNLAEAADRGLELASRINRLAHTSSSITRVDTRALFAISSVSHLRRLDQRASGVA